MVISPVVSTSVSVSARANPNQLLLYKLYFTMSISNWLVFMVSIRVRVRARETPNTDQSLLPDYATKGI